MLGVGSRDSIDSAQFTYTVGRVESSDAVNASVPVGRIRCIQLVAASDPVDTGKTNDCILNGKSEVPGNAEYFGYTEVLKPRQNVFDYGGRRCFLCWALHFIASILKLLTALRLRSRFRQSTVLDNKVCDLLHTFAALQIRKNEGSFYAHSQSIR